jgi:hypothetical protein
MDRTCGGDWWRQVALDAHGSSPKGDYESAAFQVVGEYARRLGHDSGMQFVTVPVRRRISHQPVYHLVFLTRSPYGLWVFADAIARARHDWMRALGPAHDDEGDALFSFADGVDDQIAVEQRSAEEGVRRNLRTLLADGRRARLVDHVWAVFGDRYGVATEPTVRKALRSLEQSGELVVIQNAKHLRDFVVSAKPIGQPVAASD